MPDDIHSPLASRLETAEAESFSRMKPVNEIVAIILRHRDAMVALSKHHGTDPLDVLCMVENLTDWAGAIEREIRGETHQGSIEFWR